jgi:hypothetical protein
VFSVTGFHANSFFTKTIYKHGKGHSKFMKHSRKPSFQSKIKVGNLEIESVCSFQYTRKMVNPNNVIEEERKERISAGNRVYYINKEMFTNKLLSRSTKLRLYNAVVKPVVTYAWEMWKFLEGKY